MACLELCPWGPFPLCWVESPREDLNRQDAHPPKGTGLP
jgi:hypothetical protein